MELSAVALQLVLGFTIGLSLGLLGGGGSILTVPALVYLVGQSPQAAVTTSLAIVGANSAIGALFHHQAGQAGRQTFNWKVALIFGGAGMVVSYLAAGLSKLLPPALLMSLFAILMFVIGGMMLLTGRKDSPVSAPTSAPTSAPEHTGAPEYIGAPEHTSAPDHTGAPEYGNPWLTLLSGAGVGLLTGILGVGGGFLIVPALVMLVGLPIYQAVGTSLAIIAANSFAGLMGHLGGGIDLWVTLIFVAAGILGVFTGSKLAHRLPARRLRQLFAVFVILLSIFLMIDNAPQILANARLW